MFGHYTYVYLVPDLDIGIFHSCNKAASGQIRYMVSSYIFDIVHGESAWFRGPDVCSALHSRRVDPDEDKFDLSTSAFSLPQRKFRSAEEMSECWNKWEYEGSYGNYFWGNVTISSTRAHGKTYLNLLYGDMDYILKPVGEAQDRFDMVGNNVKSELFTMALEFARNAAQQVHTLTIQMFWGDMPTFVRARMLQDAPHPSLDSC